MNKFRALFHNTPIIGMIHLAGNDPIKRALEEIAIYEEEGIDGVIVENFHGSKTDVIKTLAELAPRKKSVKVGVNILLNEFSEALQLANQYGADFIQLDHVAGKYNRGEINADSFMQMRSIYKHIVVLGGVWPKYYQPIDNTVHGLKKDLLDGMNRSDAIVVTGEGTGKATPLEKIIEFRRIIGNYPLVIGAGLNPENAYTQLMIADGAIVGSYFKRDASGDENTENPLNRSRIKELMDVVYDVRAEKNK